MHTDTAPPPSCGPLLGPSSGSRPPRGRRCRTGPTATDLPPDGHLEPPRERAPGGVRPQGEAGPPEDRGPGTGSRAVTGATKVQSGDRRGPCEPGCPERRSANALLQGCRGYTEHRAPHPKKHLHPDRALTPAAHHSQEIQSPHCPKAFRTRDLGTGRQLLSNMQDNKWCSVETAHCHHSNTLCGVKPQKGAESVGMLPDLSAP